MMIGESLQKIVNVEGIEGCIVVSRDGLILDNAGKIDASLTSMAAISATALGSAEVMGDTMNYGTLHQQVLEFDKGKAVVQQVSSDLLLLVIASNKANLGMIRHTINNTIEALRSSLV